MNIDDLAWHSSPGDMSTGFHERAFDPVWASELPDTAAGRWTIASGTAAARARRVADDAIEVEVRSDRPVGLRVNSHYYPGWGVRVDGADVPFAVTPGLGYIDVRVPAGEHVVAAEFRNTRLRTAANATSAAAAALLAVVTIVVYTPRRRWRVR